jgi:hypothetical protein
MAYANLVAQSCSNPAEIFMRFRDFICKRNGTYNYSSTGVGWTLYDSYYAINESTISVDDYFVIYSAGEDGQRDMYFQIKFLSGYIVIIGMLYWNSSTNTAVGVFGSDNNQFGFTDSNIVYVYADLDAFYVVSRNIDYVMGWGGWMPDSTIGQAITVASNAITAGSSVTVTFTAIPAGWYPGTYLFVRDQAHIESVQITDISGLDVTFQTFVNSYAAGSKFVLEHTVFCGAYLQIAHEGSLNTNYTMYTTSLPGPTNRDYLLNKYVSQKIDVCTLNTFMGPLPHILCSVPFGTVRFFSVDETTGYRYFPLSTVGDILILEV